MKSIKINEHYAYNYDEIDTDIRKNVTIDNIINQYRYLIYSDPYKAVGCTYILPNGKYIIVDLDEFDIHYDFCRDVALNVLCKDVDDRYAKNFDNDIENIMMAYLETQLGLIRCNGGFGGSENRTYVALYKEHEPTSAQYKSLEDWMYSIWQNHGKQKIQVYVDGGNQATTYNFSETLPEEIIKKIKRAYTTGTLVEQELTEMKSNGNKITDERILQLIEECKLDMTKINFGLGLENLDFDDLDFFEGDALHTFGTFHWPESEFKTPSIILNKHMFEETDEAIKNTILHEMCHYVVFKDGINKGVYYTSSPNHWKYNLDELEYYGGKSAWSSHGSRWRKVADKVGQATGQTISRTDSYSTHTGVGQHFEDSVKYVIKCKHCGYVYKFAKKTKFVKAVLDSNGHPEHWWCNCKDGTKSHDFEIIKGK